MARRRGWGRSWRARAHPTPALRADPPPQGEGLAIRQPRLQSEREERAMAKKAFKTRSLRNRQQPPPSHRRHRLGSKIVAPPRTHPYRRGRFPPAGADRAVFCRFRLPRDRPCDRTFDGSQHSSERGLQHDEKRTAFLGKPGLPSPALLGIRRCSTNCDAVLDTIFAIVQQRQILLAEARPFSPHPGTACRPSAATERVRKKSDARSSA